MIPLTLAEVAAAAGGTVHDADPATVVTGLTTDSRAVTPGDLFAALQGEQADGTRFAPDALAAGAAAALVPVTSAAGTGKPEGTPVPLARVEVPDVLAAMAAVGAEVRRRSSATVVGITGSSGKTITKDLLASVLATRLRTVAARGSFNNEIGLPLTLARLTPETEALVLEMGARGVGHIARLCQVARPDIGVVTNVGVAHYGMFGSAEAIATAKGELVEALPPGGAAVLNADDRAVAAMAERTSARVVTYAVHATTADVRAEGLTLDDLGRASFRLVTPDGDAPVTLPAPGEHLAADAAAAAAAGWLLGVGAADTARGLSTATLSPHRMQVTRRGDGVVVMNDAYNANPASMAAGLKTLRAARPAGGRAIAVLGEMAELGEIARDEHDRIGRLLVRLGVDRVVGIGPLARLTVEAARQEGIWEPDDAAAVDDADAAAALLKDLRPGDVVLVKASRAAGLEALAAALAADDTEPPGSAKGPLGGRR